MALFKIFKGQSAHLVDVKATDGYAYFTPDNGEFFIDISSESKAITSDKEGTVGEGEVNRICINPHIIDCGQA